MSISLGITVGQKTNSGIYRNMRSASARRKSLTRASVGFVELSVRLVIGDVKVIRLKGLSRP